MRKYPTDFDPFKGSQTAHLAYLFSMLGNAYATLAQYEAEGLAREREEEQEEFRQVFEERKKK